MTLNQAGEKVYEYVLLTRQPIDYGSIGSHELLAIAENAQSALLIYKDKSTKAQAEILKRDEANDGIGIQDIDFEYTVTWAPSEDGPEVEVRWREGRQAAIYQTEERERKEESHDTYAQG